MSAEEVPDQVPSGNTGGAGGGNNTRNDRRGNRRQNQNPNRTNTAVMDWGGESGTTFNYVLTTPSERVLYKRATTIEKFKEALKVETSRWKGGVDIRAAIMDGTDVVGDLYAQGVVVHPNVPAAHQPVAEANAWNAMDKRAAKMEENLKRAYAFVMGQCTPGLKTMLEASDEFNDIDADQDFQELMRLITDKLTGSDPRSDIIYVIFQRLKELVTVRQGEKESTADYHARFRVVWENFLATGLVDHFRWPRIANPDDPDAATEEQLDAIEERFKSMNFLMGSEDTRFLDLKQRLYQNHNERVGTFPHTMADTLHLLGGHRNVANASQANSYQGRLMERRQNGAGRLGHQFHQRGGPGRGDGGRGRGGRPRDNDGILRTRDGRVVDCRVCNGNHYANLLDGSPNPECRGNGGGDGNQNVSRTHHTSYSFSQLNHRMYPDSEYKSSIPSTLLLVDSASTDNLLMPHMATGIRKCTPDEELKLISNGGVTYHNRIGYSRLFPLLESYVSDSTLANILSLFKLTTTEGIYVLMDSRVTNAIVVVVDEIAHVFRACGIGLYALDLNDYNSRFNLTSIPRDFTDLNFCFAIFKPSHQTVADNKAQFTNRQIEGADKAREIQRITHFMADDQYKLSTTENHIKNLPINSDDINRANTIYGPPLPILEGKMTWTAPQPIDPKKLVSLPDYILQHHKDVHLLVDNFYVNGIKFLLTKSTVIKYLHGQLLRNGSKRTLIDALLKSFHIYESRGFEIHTLTGDNEYEIDELRDAILPTALHTVGAGEHVGGIEREVRTIKERARCTVQANPYDYATKLMVIQLVYDVIDWLDAVPARDGISDNLSPDSIVTGGMPPDFSQRWVPVWTYCLAYTSTDNTNKRRSLPCITLRKNKKRGGYYCMSLLSGRKIHAHKFTPLPISKQVIDRVHKLAKDEGQPSLNRNGKKGLIFEWYPGVEVRDIDEQDRIEAEWIQHQQGNIHEFPEDAVIIEDDDDVTVGIDELEEGEFDWWEADPNIANQNEALVMQVAEIHDNEQIIVNNEQEAAVEEEAEPQDELGEIVIEVVNDDVDDAASDIEEQIQEIQGADNNDDNDDEPVLRRSQRENAGVGPVVLEPVMYGRTHNVRRIGRQFFLNSIKSKGYSTNNRYKKGSVVGHYGEVYTKTELLNLGLGVMFAQVGEHDQISVKAASERFGEERVFAALFKEYKQLIDGAIDGKSVIIPTHPNKLTSKEKYQALESVNQMKLKPPDPTKGIDEAELKARCCADGRKQRRFIDPEENTSSPTVSHEGNLISLLIDVYEGRDVAISDVKGAFLQAPTSVEKDGTRKVMKFRGRFAEIMAEINPEYKDYMVEENGKKVLYVLLAQAIYGTIDAALRWYELYSTTLVKMGFKINPYDLCVANKMINGKQCTISWYVDDNKISHKDPKVVDEVIKEIESHFGPMKCSRGDKHKLLGMNIEIDRKRKVLKVDMKELLSEAITKFEVSGEIINSTVPHPATGMLMTVNPDAVLLSEEKANIFHSVTATLLHVTKRTRPDLETSIGFLTKRVSKPDEDDWKKLKRVLQYCLGTIDEVRIIGASSLKQIFTWIDAAYAVHPDMKSQTGGCVSLGIGILHAKSSTQKINTKSSTEAELVGMSEYLPYNIWMYNFISAQGYEIQDNVMYQDNQSAIKMEKNGRMSSTGRTRHIHIRYFWVKDLVEQKLIKIEYCPTENMLADFFTKPLNGYLFKYLKSFVMGHKPMSELQRLTPAENKQQRKNETKTVKNQERVGENIFLPVTETKHTRIPTYAEIVRKNNMKNKNTKIFTKSIKSNE